MLDSSSEEDASPKQQRRIAAKKPPLPSNVDAAEASFDRKWRALIAKEEDLPEFTQEEFLRAFGTLMARLSHLEEAQRRDRLRILYLDTERKTLYDLVKKIDKSVQESLIACVPPSHKSVMDAADVEPREMTLHEAKRLELQLRRLKADGRRVEECCKIMDTTPDANGVVTWDLASVPARKKWQLYYYLFFQKIEKKTSLSERTAKRVEAIEAAGISRLNIDWSEQFAEPDQPEKPAKEEEESSEYDLGDSEDEEDEENEDRNELPHWEG